MILHERTHDVICGEFETISRVLTDQRDVGRVHAIGHLQRSTRTILVFDVAGGRADIKGDVARSSRSSSLNPEIAPLKSKESWSTIVPVAAASRVTLADEAAPKSSVAVPSSKAVPVPVTAPLAVMLPPCAQSRPELSTSLLMTSPPLPVASSVPELVIAFAPVSMTSAFVPVAMIVPSLTSAIWPAPSWPAPEIVLSTLVSVTLSSVPEITLSALSDRVTWPPPSSVTPYWMSCSSVPLPAEFERDRAGVVDDAAERQHRAVADRHRAGVVRHRRQVEHEVVVR